MKSLILLSFVGCLASACPVASKPITSTTTSISTSTTASTTASTTTTTKTTTTKSCQLTATPIASLCGYPEPLDENAFAEGGPEDCWRLCSKDKTCNFMIYRQAYDDPFISGPGTCWAYPNLKYSPAKAEKCTGDQHPSLFVYGNPECKPPVTCYPSAETLVDEICEYVQPDNPEKNVFVADGPEACWKACGDDPKCTYTIFKKSRGEILGVLEPNYCYIFDTDETYHVGRGIGQCAGSRTGPTMSVYVKNCNGKTA
ncbi:hypothetical protein TWF694_010005 [Orbilia ellipsospora]|uniref:Apple domain-containing protein n=1 Tax=Orbilia ellipsospora TaxID=2528407 RepID=A0AAV9X8K8_9PEZI